MDRDSPANYFVQRLTSDKLEMTHLSGCAAYDKRGSTLDNLVDVDVTKGTVGPSMDRCKSTY